MIYKQTTRGKNLYIYAEKRPGKMVMMACVGDLAESEKERLNQIGISYKPAVLNLNPGSQSLSSQYPAPTPSEITVSRAMTYRQLADELDYTGYGMQIAGANNADIDDVIELGHPIIIPNIYYEIPETAWNGGKPTIDSLVGSLYPTMTMPQMWFKDKPINWIEIAIEAAVGAAIAILIPYALGLYFCLESIPAAVLVGGLVGTTASSADQLIAMGFGSQKEFSCGQVLESGLICAATAGVAKYNGVLNTKGAPFIQRFVSNKLGQNILTALEIYTLKHGIDFAKGDTRFLNFNVRSLGVAIANAVIGTAVENVAPVDTFRVSNVALNTVIDGVVDPLIMKEQLNMKRLSATMIGNMVGNYAGNKLVELNQESKKAEVAQAQVQARVIRNDGKIVSGDHPDKIDRSGPQSQSRAERWNSTRGKSKDWGNYLEKYNEVSSSLSELPEIPELPLSAAERLLYLASNPEIETNHTRKWSLGALSEKAIDLLNPISAVAESSYNTAIAYQRGDKAGMAANAAATALSILPVGKVAAGLLSKFAFLGKIGEMQCAVYHTVLNNRAGQGVLDGIDPLRLNSSSRFGKAFYLSEIPDTTLAELAHHNAIGANTIRFYFNKKSAQILDLTNPKTAQVWGYEGGEITSLTKMIGKKAQNAGFNVIRYSSERGAGSNLAVLSDFNRLLKPQMIVPTPAINSKLTTLSPKLGRKMR